MDIVIIGTGNVAFVLGRLFRNSGHRIIQIVGRNTSAASELAYELDTDSTNYWSLINKTADVYIIAVADKVIEETTSELRLPGKVVAHTAGAVTRDVLKNVTNHYGVFYPLQTINKNSPPTTDIPFFVDGADSFTKDTLQSLARSISSHQAVMSSDEQRLKLHVAAVVVNNFTNYLYSLAEEFCAKENIDFRLLMPLIRETAMKISDNHPEDVQTGPALRNDVDTINLHIKLLDNHPELRKIYQFLTENIRLHSQGFPNK